jgi:transcriptional regulator with XRE-family HTH domain
MAGGDPVTTAPDIELTATHPASRACYLRGCREPGCSDANYRYMSRYRLDREHGQKRRTNAAPASSHVRTLLDAGWNQRQISDAAQCAHRVVASLANNRQPTVHADLAARILAINPHPVPAPAQYVDATGTTRRIRALVAIGYTLRQLSKEIGIWPANLARIARGELAQVTVGTAASTAGVYRRLGRRPGPSRTAAARARRDGWHSPIAWGDNIDDPNAEPDVPPVVDTALKRDELAAIRREEIWILATAGADNEEIARRVGVAPSTVQGVRASLRGVKRDRKAVAA